MENINIIYIDDQIDRAFERYLDKKTYQAIFPEYTFNYREVKYDPNEGYLSLVQNPTVQEANIIFVDSKLFSDETVTGEKISGEEFKIIVKILYPYIEVIVITQNGEDPTVGTIAKFRRGGEFENAQDYYANKIPDILRQATTNIGQYRKLAEQLKKSAGWEKALKEKVLSAIDGTSKYDTLTSQDITRFIEAFKEIQRHINE